MARSGKLIILTEENYSDKIHNFLREEMILELAKLKFFVEKKVIEKRLLGRNLTELSIEGERESCFNEKGLLQIQNTANILFEQFWKRKIEERWTKNKCF